MTNTVPCALDDHALQQLLDEDVRFGDLTTESLGIQARPGRIRFFARDAMTVCCSEEAARLLPPECRPDETLSPSRQSLCDLASAERCRKP